MKPTERKRTEMEQYLRNRLIDVADAESRNSNEPITAEIVENVYRENVDAMGARKFSRFCKMVDKEVRRISSNTRRKMKSDTIVKWNPGRNDNQNQNQKEPRKNKRVDDLLLYAIEVPGTGNRKKGEETESVFAYVNILNSQKLLEEKAKSLDKYGANVLGAAVTLADYAKRTWTRNGWRRK